MRASEWRVLALRLWMWDMIGCWQVHECICDGACVVRSSSTVALRIFALFAEWCSRACAGESCVVTSVFWRMQAHSELILNASWCGFEQVRLSVAFIKKNHNARTTPLRLTNPREAAPSWARRFQRVGAPSGGLRFSGLGSNRSRVVLARVPPSRVARAIEEGAQGVSLDAAVLARNAARARVAKVA